MRLHSFRWPVILAGFALLASADCARAADKEKITKVKITTVKPHKQEVFDLTNPDHLQKVQNHLKAGNIEELSAHEELNLLELKWDTAFWTIVVFILLFLILRKTAWGPMLEGLQKREDNIQSAIVEAKEAKEEAAKLKEELRREREMAAEKVREMMEEARKDAQTTRDEMLAKAKSEIQAERDRLLREINTAKDQALQEIWTQSAQLATLISSKAIRRELNEADHRRLVDDALTELRASAGNGKSS